jgi:hypothetical protein
MILFHKQYFPEKKLFGLAYLLRDLRILKRSFKIGGEWGCDGGNV